MNFNELSTALTLCLKTVEDTKDVAEKARADYEIANNAHNDAVNKARDLKHKMMNYLNDVVPESVSRVRASA